MGRAKGRKHGVLALDLLPMHVRQELIAKRKLGWSYARLTQYIKEIHGESYNENTVTRWMKRRVNTVRSEVYGTPEFRNMVAEEYSKVMVNAREVSDILVSSIKDLREVSRDNVKDGKIRGIKDLNTSALTFLEYFKEIKNVLKDCAGVEDMDVGIELINDLRTQGQITVKQVRPEVK